MSTFTLAMSSPFRAGSVGDLGGPNQGGHGGANWYIRYGMDLGVKEGTEVFAAFDAYVHRFNPHDRSQDSAKVYGAQLFVRADQDGDSRDKLSGFYTHITGQTFSAGQKIKRGDRLGTTLRDHLHFALVENLPGGKERGVVELYQKFLSVQSSSDTFSVTFGQDGTAPRVALPAPIPAWVIGWWKVIWRNSVYYYYMGGDGLARWTHLPASPTTPPPITNCAPNTGSLTFKFPSSVSITWFDSGNTETLTREPCSITGDIEMTGKWNGIEMLEALKL